jgi:hypothetical protein
VPGKVCGNGSHLTELGQLILGLLARIGLARADDDARACLQQTAGHHHADAPGAAGDEGGFAGQVEKFCVRSGLAVRHWVAFHRRLERNWARVHPRDWLPAYVGSGYHLAVLMRSAPIVIPAGRGMSVVGPIPGSSSISTSRQIGRAMTETATSLDRG